MSFDLDAIGRMAVALLGGLAVGLEREWSGHASGPHPHLGGLRTFTLLGLISGATGWLWTAGFAGPAVVLLSGAVGLVLIGYVASSRTDVGATTEVAALVVLTVGVLAGAGAVRVASALVAVTVLLLVEKRELRSVAGRLDDTEMRAGALFAAMAIVILPLVPAGPYGPFGGVRPRALWILVLLLSGLSFAGYIARRIVGSGRGYALTGVLGGLVSSTSVTLSMATLSRRESALGGSLAAGTLGACVIMFPRMLFIAALISGPLAHVVWPLFLAPVAIGLLLFSRGLRLTEATEAPPTPDENPLGLGAALKMALFFQAVLFLVTVAQGMFGQSGVYASAGLIGLTEVDAITISVAQHATSGMPIDVAARAMLIGALANTVAKLGITLVAGRGTFRPLAAAGLGLMAAALIAALVLTRG
jgi:uncharacterized membrane protein (DUF4010 family)